MDTKQLKLITKYFKEIKRKQAFSDKYGMTRSYPYNWKIDAAFTELARNNLLAQARQYMIDNK